MPIIEDRDLSTHLNILTIRDESGSIPVKKEILLVEDAYRGALVGVGPNPALLGKTTDRAFRQFVEDLLQVALAIVDRKHDPMV